jgi:rhodanese-related sulfurtransferase
MDTQRILEFVSNHWILASALFVVTLLLVQDLFDSVTRRYKVTSPLGAVTLLNNEQTVVVDVREPDEFAKGHIENAIHISLGRLDERMYELEPHKETPVIVTCQQGTRAASACAKLTKAGFKQIYYLKGGMLSWEDQKLPISTKKKK